MMEINPHRFDDYYRKEKPGLLTKQMKEEQFKKDILENLDEKDDEYLKDFYDQFVKPELENNIYQLKNKELKKVWLFPWQKKLLTNYYNKAIKKDNIDKRDGLSNIYLISDMKDVEYLLRDFKTDIVNIDGDLEIPFELAIEDIFTYSLSSTERMIAYGIGDLFDNRTRTFCNLFKNDYITTSDKDGYPTFKSDLFVEEYGFHLCPANFIDWESFLENEQQKSMIDKLADESHQTNKQPKNNKMMNIKIHLKDIENKDGFNYVKINLNEDEIAFVKINENNFHILNGEYVLKTKSDYSYSIYDENKTRYISKINVIDFKNLYLRNEKCIERGE